MDKDTRELARQLFAQATMILEDAHELAVEGQSARLTAQAADKYTKSLQQAGQNLVMLVEAIQVVIGSGGEAR